MLLWRRVVVRRAGELDMEVSVAQQSGSQRRLVIVSNRLPVTLSADADGTWQARPGSGGLVTALAPVLRERGGVWIGWPGTLVEDGVDLAPLLREATADAGYELAPVELTAEQHENFYLGFANEIVWPLFHDLQSLCRFRPRYWRSYEEVNRAFSAVVAQETTAADYVWVQDYHLMGLAAELRSAGVDRRTGFFLHIPFPPADIFLKLPWRDQVLRGLLAYELVGFQTARDLRNFLGCVRELLPDAAIDERGDYPTVRSGDGTTRVGSFPIGIDFHEFADHAGGEEVADVAWSLREALPERQLVLGVDRLDYTKGIPERLEAIRQVLTRHPDMHGYMTFVQVVIPSRTDIPQYAELKATIEGLVGQINGQFTQPGWVPIHYLFRSLDRTDLLAYYRSAEIALVTPLKDGMNLVAKEYCAASVDNGVLILSEFAGAAPQLAEGALLVNPYDVYGMADAIYQAWSMPSAERRARLEPLRRNVHEQDVFWWVKQFLEASDVDAG
jgi:trehalose 6-phosphate synthase